MGSDDGWRVDVEVFLLSLLPDGGLAYRTVVDRLERHVAPDDLALALTRLDAVGPHGAVSHATSWRAPGDGRIVLTYAALPDSDPADAEPLVTPSIVCSRDPLRPSPPGLHAHHIAAHAVRHLAFLATSDPTVAGAQAQAPELWRAVRRVSRSLPVAEHDSAHALARQWHGHPTA